MTPEILQQFPYAVRELEAGTRPTARFKVRLFTDTRGNAQCPAVRWKGRYYRISMELELVEGRWEPGERKHGIHWVNGTDTETKQTAVLSGALREWCMEAATRLCWHLASSPEFVREAKIAALAREAVGKLVDAEKAREAEQEAHGSMARLVSEIRVMVDSDADPTYVKVRDAVFGSNLRD